MRRHALHIAAALLCFSLGMLVTDGYGRLAYALPLSLLCFLLTKTLPRVEIDFHFLMVVSMSLLLWSAGVSVIGWYFSEPFGDCVLTSDSSDFYVGCSTDAAAPKPADKPPTGLTVYTCTDADPSPLSFNPIWVGVVDKKALRKPAPLYSPLAKEVRPASTVAVSVLIDTSGNVLQAQAISGHPLLRQEAAEAACRARFPP
ncbi:MAG TPA: energy transducer TonB, partial [Pyrinomonadaceae bacterium]|nr:energy transducer TonB [Pyrinomonadaceae bacterium]